MNSDISVTMYVIEFFSVCVPEVSFEGSVSQIFYIGPSYYFMSKIGQLFVIFFKFLCFQILHFIKLKLRHMSKF